MTVHIDQLETEVVAEPPASAASGGGAAQSPWKELEKQRGLHARLRRDRQRTEAEGSRD